MNEDRNARVRFGITNRSFSFAVFAAHTSAVFNMAFVILTPRDRLITRLAATRRGTRISRCLTCIGGHARLSHVTGRGIANIFDNSCTIGPFANRGVPV